VVFENDGKRFVDPSKDAEVVKLGMIL